MVKIGYKGHRQTFKVKVGDSFIHRWDRDDIRDFSDDDANHLLKNKDFYKVSDGKSEEKKIEKSKVEKVIEEVEEVKEEVKEVVFDYVNANKDALLDFTAVHNIEADYNMSNRELRVLIKEYLENID